MKFTRLQLRGLYDIQLPVVGALPSDKYILKDSDGLGPPEVDVSISRSLTGKGSYQGRQPLDREITLRIGLNPDWGAGITPDDLRSEIYGLLTPPTYADYITLFIFDVRKAYPNDTVATTRCWAKRVEPVLFSKDPEVQVVLSCLDPYLEAPSLLSYNAVGRNTIAINNPGTAPSGMLINAVFSGPASSFEIQGSLGETILHVDWNFVNGDILYIDSRPGFEQVRVNNTSPFYVKNVAGALTSGSQWPMLRGGNNYFAGVGSNTNWSWGAVQYRPLFWGL